MEIDQDFALVNTTFLRIGDRYGERVIADQYHCDVERTVSLVWQAKGLIDNGGFEYLLSREIEGDPTLERTATAFKEAGLETAHQVFQDLFALFPDGVPHETSVRSEAFKAVDSGLRKGLNRRFWLDGTHERKLANYIRRNRRKLRHLDK